MTLTALPRRPAPGLLLLLPRAGVAAVLGAFLAATLLQPGALAALSHLRPHAPRWELLAAAPFAIQLHLAAALIAFVVGAVLLAGVKGTRLHRALGWSWIVAMAVTAVSSLFVRVIHPGHWSYIHFLSGWVIIALPMAVAAVRRRNLKLHRRLMTGLFVGGLLVAGALTFVPGRLMFAVFLG